MLSNRIKKEVFLSGWQFYTQGILTFYLYLANTSIPNRIRHNIILVEFSFCCILLVAIIIMISIQRYYKYIFKYSEIQYTGRHTGELCVLQVRTNLLTSEFSSSTRGERHNSYNADPTIWPHKCVAHPVMFKISVGRDPNNSTVCHNGRNPNYSTLWQRTQFSAPMAETQLSACMVQCRPSTDLTFKILKFSAHLFWASRHLHTSPLSCLEFIMTTVIVISFARERKLYLMLCIWSFNPNSCKPNQTEWWSIVNEK